MCLPKVPTNDGQLDWLTVRPPNAREDTDSMEVTEDSEGGEPEHQVGDEMPLPLLPLEHLSSTSALPNLTSSSDNTSNSLQLQTMSPSNAEPPVNVTLTVNTSSPKWLTKNFAFLMNQAFRPKWNRLVGLWVTLEEFYLECNEKAKSLLTKSRPKQIAFWIKCARWPSYEIESSELDKLVRQFWEWWMAINPSWRAIDSEHHLQIGGEGTWEELCCPGVNGFLSVLACLKWWKLASSETGEWEHAVNEVTWVISEMLSSFKWVLQLLLNAALTISRKRHLTPLESQSALPSKRMRR